MPRYRAFGLSVDSELALPELADEGDAGSASGVAAAGDRADAEPDVAVRRVDLESAGAAGTYRELGPQVFHYTSRAGTVRVTDGRTIAVDPVADVDPAAIRVFVLGLGFGALCHQRGLLVLHGSAVVVDGRAVAVVGDSGAGKSTTGAALAARGHGVLADDLTVVDVAGAGPTVRPAFPALKLAPETVAALDGDWTAVADGELDDRQYYRPPDDAPSAPSTEPSASDPSTSAPSASASRASASSASPLSAFETLDSVPLAGVCVLRVGDARERERLSGKAVPALVGATYTARVLSETAARERNFRDCASVAEHCDVVRLQRDATGDDPEDLARAVEQIARRD